MADIIVEALRQTPVEKQRVELVERKGTGHPDSSLTPTSTFGQFGAIEGDHEAVEHRQVVATDWRYRLRADDEQRRAAEASQAVFTARGRQADSLAVAFDSLQRRSKRRTSEVSQDFGSLRTCAAGADVTVF
ncbi:MAG: hypothetical protein M5U01_41330 [Ardenticatenaceae bacterium]|nr:hypothetical protein [Ardenticatenaceae bacterium]